MILDGKKIANELLDSVKSEILKADLATKNLTLPCLAVILVGDNPASLQYIKMKRKRAEEVGMNFLLKNFEKLNFYTKLRNLRKILKSMD